MSIYFDNAATTPVSRGAVLKLAEITEKAYGNPSSNHAEGFLASHTLEAARETLASLLRASPSELYFTSGGTESNNLALFGAPKKRGCSIVTSKAEHPSVIECVKKLEQSGFEAVFLTPSTGGEINFDELSEAITEKTALVSIMHVNHETGVISDLENIGRIIKQKNKNALFHVDAVQSFGKHIIEIKKWNIDLLGVSAHKLHGPKGTGALYVREGVRLAPLLYGGGQQRGLRPGTENPAGAAAFAFAAQEACGMMTAELERIGKIKEKLLSLTEKYGFAFLNGDAARQSPYITNISFPGVPSEVMQNALNAEGVYVSSGAACSTGKKAAHNVPFVYGLGKARANSTIRISLGRQNTIDEAEAFIEILERVLKKLIGRV